ncbi:MAG: hypothetical protein ACXWC4_13630 [Telluria sp.]
MSDPAATNVRLVPVWGKSALLVALFFFGCWGAAIIYWRATGHMPGAGELAFCLVGVPLLLAGGLWLSRRLIEPGAPVAAGASAAEPRAAMTSTPAALAILAGALRLPHGSSPEELLSAMKSNKARPDLDPQLRDDDGFPVMTSRCAAAGDEIARDEIVEWCAANGVASTAFSDEQWRALVMGTQVVRELASGQPAMEKLQLLALIPPDWPPDQCKTCHEWLAHTIRQCGWSHDQIDVVAGDAHPTPASALAALEQSAGVALVVALASNVGDRTVAAWSGSGRLFTSSRQQGLVPGEGAAGLLLVASARATTPAVVLESIEEGKLGTSADNGKRIDAKLLDELARRALSRAAIQPGQVSAVVSDTGHRTNRVLELMNLGSSLLPELDANEDMLRIAASTGICGVVPAMAALVLAHHKAIESAAPVLWVSNEDAYSRAVGAIRPPTPG